MIPNHPLEFYDSIDDEQGDYNWDEHPLREEIKDWLDMLPRGSWTVDHEYRGYNYARDQAPFLRWNRPIRFRFRYDATLFYLRWNQHPDLCWKLDNQK